MLQVLPTDSGTANLLAEDADDRTQLRDQPNSGARSYRSAPGSVAGTSIAPNVLKSRFVLEDQLGSGGMGTVYRAKDLRKVEAQDKQPYLAIKVLNGDFREHPDAFIALQREAAKSQSLSHRNIVKIFDFDKDGDVPFMTMELLRGSELATLLREYPQGLPESLAWPVIRGFCSALKHAHAEGVIHADIKPGNLFVTHAGQVKIFDFGLARAVHANFSQGVLQTRSDVEDLVFDAAALGALTPAFASRAMLQGESPSASDDVFAAALVIYQILTGKHPYNRIPADKLDQRGAVLERPKHLTSRQWRALSAALALEEADRLPSIAALKEGLFQTSPWPMRLLAASLGVIAIALWGFGLQKDNQIRVVQEQAVQAGRVEAGVDRILELIKNPSLDEAWELRVTDELNRLEELEDSERLVGNSKAQISSLYVQNSMNQDELAVAAAIAARGERFGSMDAAWESISQRIQQRLQVQLDEPTPTTQWFENTENILTELATLTRDPHRIALAQHETHLVYLNLLEANAQEMPANTVEFALEKLDRREFDLDRVAAARDALSASVRSVALEIERDQARLDVAAFGQGFVDQGCLVGELGVLREQHALLRVTDGANKAELSARTDKLLAGCVQQLIVLDPDAAASFRREALAQFGALPRTQAVSIDPCDRQYLVGAGRARGRSGTCVDVGEAMPQLVVLPSPVGPFAVTRYEISAREFSAFCSTQEEWECPDIEAQHPATSISVNAARAYAAWLSSESGFRYRLPTLDEWVLASRAGVDEPDANRNCRVDLGGVSRGGATVPANVGALNQYGLANAFGNVAEWVDQADVLLSVGGHFDDSLTDCASAVGRESAGVAEPQQGFRLVREIAARSEVAGS